MTEGQIKDFWDTLCNLDGVDIQKDIKILGSKIFYPKFLYRYRAVNYNTLEALMKNKLYFSTANYYDDPFDTFLHIDFDGLSKFKDGVINPNNVDMVKQSISEVISKVFLNYFGNIEVDELTKNIIESLGNA